MDDTERKRVAKELTDERLLNDNPSFNKATSMIILKVDPINYDNHQRKIDLNSSREKYLDLIKDKKWGDASEVLVDHLLKFMKIYTTKDDQKSEVWIYKDGIYIPQGKSEIKEYLRNMLGKYYSTFVYNMVIAKIEPDTYIDQDRFFSTNYSDEVPVQNGILNIFTKELSEFTPEKIFFNKMPIFYNPDSKCPNIKKHFKTILRAESDSEVMFELFGYLLYKKYKIEKAAMFVGKGRNGKSKTLELMKHFIGATNCSNLPLAMMKSESFCISELFGKMANLSGDLSHTDLKETGTIKMLTGRDTIQAKRKFLKDLNFVNYAKLIFAANELPKVYDMSDGWWSRWILLEFPYKFLSDKDYFDLPEKERTNFRLMDPSILEDLTTPEELSGLLNESLIALNRLLDHGDFSYSKGTQEIKDLWIRQSDSFMAFCLDHVESGINEYLPKQELRKYYCLYCKKHKLRGCSDIAIRASLQSLFGADESQKTIIIDDKYKEIERVWVGIKLKNLEGI